MPYVPYCNCVACCRARGVWDASVYTINGGPTPEEPEIARTYGQLMVPTTNEYYAWIERVGRGEIPGYRARTNEGTYLIRHSHATVPAQFPNGLTVPVSTATPTTGEAMPRPVTPRPALENHEPTSVALPLIPHATPDGRRLCCVNGCKQSTYHRPPVDDSYIEAERWRVFRNSFEGEPLEAGNPDLPPKELFDYLKSGPICSSCGRCLLGEPVINSHSAWRNSNGHCRCWECPTCPPTSDGKAQRHLPPPCPVCRRCDLRCDCATCSYCGQIYPRRQDRWCNNPGHTTPVCSGCCLMVQEQERNRIQQEEMAMNREPPWSRERGHLHSNPTEVEFRVGEAHKLWPLTRCVSLEVEICGSNGDKNKENTYQSGVFKGRIKDKYKHLRKYLKGDGKGTLCVRDGSLPEGGYELNLIPSSGDKWVKQLTTLNEALVDDDAFATTAAGMHCHVDTRDLRDDNAALLRLCNLYSKLEPALFSIVEPSRRNNNYCIKVGANMAKVLKEAADPDVQLRYKKGSDAIHKAIYGVVGQTEDEKLRIERMKKEHGHTHYWALNMHSHFYRGSVEFRIHHGTVDRKQWLNWSLVCASIVDFAKKRSDEEVEAVTANIEGLKSILPSELCRKWVDARAAALK